MNSEVHIFDVMDDDIDKLGARHHEFDVKHFVIHKISHQRLKTTFLAAYLFETIKRLEDDFVTTCENPNTVKIGFLDTSEF